jgi:predicted nucleic acid-binding protein
VRSILERYAEEVSFLTPQSCVTEARTYLPELCVKRRWPVAPALAFLEVWVSGIHVVENAALAELEAKARQRIGDRDPDDWPVVALAIAAEAPVWTEDRDFFGAGVATWTTQTVELYLSRAPSR